MNKNKIRSFCIVVMLIFLTLPVFSQTTFSGYIFETGTIKPIRRVFIVITGTDCDTKSYVGYTTTSVFGVYSISMLEHCSTISIRPHHSKYTFEPSASVFLGVTSGVYHSNFTGIRR